MQSSVLPSLDFHQSNTLHTTHGLHAFAAKFPPQLAEWAIERYSQPNHIICDPMSGSGTTLVEACRLGRRSIGFDIDPLACLIARAKSTPLNIELLCDHNQQLIRVIEELQTQYTSELTSGALPATWTTPLLPNLDYWFQPQVQVALLLIKRAIAHVEASVEIKTLWYTLFSSLIVAKNSVANARDIVHSRHHFYAHSERPDPISRFRRRLEQVERRMLEFQNVRNRQPLEQARVVCQDSRDIPLDDASVDLVIMSPPYCNALDYTRAHRFAVAWLSDVLETTLQDYMGRGRDYIGSERRQRGQRIVPIGIAEVDNISSQIGEIDVARGRLVAAYFSDMACILKEIGRILRPGGHAVVVVCPSNIRKVPIAWHEAFAEIGQHLPPETRLREVALIPRTIDDRRRILPYMNAGTQLASRMRTEYVQVLYHGGHFMSRSKPSADIQTRLFLRLTARDPTAPSDFVRAFLPALLDAMRGTFKDMQEPTLVDDCVIDTLIKFPIQPEKYDPKRGSLWTYLHLDAKRDILNALDKERRRLKNEEPVLACVVVEEQSRNEEQAQKIFHQLLQDETPDYLPSGVSLEQVRSEVDRILANPMDQTVVELIVAGVRETGRYAETLCITHLPITQQRQQVKQVKDRLKKSLTRLGANLNDT